mmetsp:Transcript_11873/g.22850  ORF Transcript_11873/g.22850 Transcript_11873/m.22850 type:complete len:484 (+) Transcript_11873:365-1816(+)
MKSLLLQLCLIGIISGARVAGFSPTARGCVHRPRPLHFTPSASFRSRPSSFLWAVNQDDRIGLLDPPAFERPEISSSQDAELVHEVDAELVQEAGTSLNASNKPNGDDNRNMARLLLIGAAALYGTNFSVVKMLGQTDMSIALSATLRFGLAALITSPWLFGKTENPNTNEVHGEAMDHRLGVTLRGMEVGFWNSAGYIAQAVGLGTTLASKSAFLCSLAVVTVPLLDFATGKRLETRQITGIVLALLGVAVLELGGLSASDLALTSGDLASMVQPLAFGVAFWRMEQVMHKYPEEAKRATAAQLLAVFLGSAAYGFVTDPGFFDMTKIIEFVSEPTVLLSLFWTGCITTALTIYMESTALKSLSAAETTLILSTEPLWGTAFAAAVLGEQVGVDTGIGAVLIIAACLVSNLGLDGIKNLVAGASKSTRQEGKVNDSDVEYSTLARGGFFAAAGSSFLGAIKDTVIQIQDILFNVFPQGPPDF